MFLLAEEASQWLQVVHNPTILAMIGTGIAFLWGLFKAKTHLKDKKWATQISPILEEAVDHTYKTYVGRIKRQTQDSPGRKLTMEEIAKAREIAWEKAKELGKTRGIDIAKDLAAHYIPALIDKYVRKAKTGE